MRIWSEGAWIDGFLPYHVGDGEIGVQVTHWAVLQPVRGLYFERPGSWRMVFNYLRELGPFEVWRKIRSRRAEQLRNRKFLSVGRGWFKEGGRRRACVFVAPSHPAGSDFLSLPVAAVFPVDRNAEGSSIRHADRRGDAVPEALLPLIGWSPASGVAVAPEIWAAAGRAATALCDAIDWPGATETPRADEPAAARPAPRAGRAALYGLGNYAKVHVVPSIQRHLGLDRIAEIDPLQLPRIRSAEIEWSTAPEPAADDRFDAYFIAGYHHSHAPIAVHAIAHGGAAVVEKPIAMDQAQLDAVLAAMQANPQGRLFAGYHKRYSKLTSLARQDLAAAPGDAIDYHCIVYEVPLPPLHWYRWPNSHTRILSNGCHWIDHFLFLNDYCPPRAINVFASRDGTMNCSMELENGAIFSMALTERGSERLGVRDHIELRHGRTTVRITDGTRYASENSERVLRTLRVNKVESYHSMYATIADAVAKGLPGDSLASIAVGAQAVIDMERAAVDRYPALRASAVLAPPSANAMESGQ